VRLLHLLAGSVVLRPYVFVFLAVYLVTAVTRLGWWRTVAFTLIAWAIAYVAEFSSTRTGFPFGLYVYLDGTRDRELWLANVPFFDSLSFTFLCYLGYALALFLYSPLAVSRRDFQVLDAPEVRASPRVLLTGAFFVMLIDLVIDPLTLRGDRWFLGRIYYYPGGGIHFGVPLSNYAGWFLVALVTLGLYQRVERRVRWSRAGARHVPYAGVLEPAIYLGILLFNLALTFWIGETLLGLLGCMLYAPVVVLFLSHPLNPMRRTAAAMTYAVLLVPVTVARPAAALTGSRTPSHFERGPTRRPESPDLPEARAGTGGAAAAILRTSAEGLAALDKLATPSQPSRALRVARTRYRVPSAPRGRQARISTSLPPLSFPMAVVPVSSIRVTPAAFSEEPATRTRRPTANTGTRTRSEEGPRGGPWANRIVPP